MTKIMKKIIITLAIVFIAVNVNAQWFLAGSIGINVRNVDEKITWNNNDMTLKISEIGFLIAPKAGYYFNEKLALGLGFSVGPNFKKISDNDYKYKENSVNWRVFPFVRYSVFTYKKFSIILEGRTGVGGEHAFWKFGDEKKKRKLTTLAIGVINITPILGFNLTDHIQIEARLHFLNLGYNIDITKGDPTYDMDVRKINTTKHDFNIGFNSSSILTITQLQFGVIYKF
jgi:hypothetical protein